MGVWQPLLLLCLITLASETSGSVGNFDVGIVGKDKVRRLFEGEEDDDAGSVALDWEAHHRQIVIHWTPGNETDWVQVLKDKGHSHAMHCKLPPEKDAVPRTSPLVVTAHELVPTGKRRIAWFFVLGFNPTPAYEEMVKRYHTRIPLALASLLMFFIYFNFLKLLKICDDIFSLSLFYISVWC
jgi:hypothetical protein